MKHGKFLGYLKNGAPVYDRPVSHIHTEYDKIYEMLTDVLPDISLSGTNEVFTCSHDFGDVIGESIRVVTDEHDEIVYAQRYRRKGLTRFAKNRTLRPTSVLTVCLKRDSYVDIEQYILMTAYIGEQAPPEPWDKDATPESALYWKQNALVWGTVPVVPGTETTDCPW